MIRVEDLHGEVEYNVLPPDHPLHFVAQARVTGRIRHSREGDMSYPHCYMSAWNAEVRRFISVTQKALDEGSIWPAGSREIPAGEYERKHPAPAELDAYYARTAT